MLGSWARFPSTPNLNPILVQIFPVPFAAPAGEASSGEIQDTLPELPPIQRGVPQDQEWSHSLPKSSSGGTGVIDLLGLLIKLLPLAFHFNLFFFFFL